MKKIFMALSLAALMTLGACSSKTSDENKDSNDTITAEVITDSSEMVATSPTAMPSGDASASSIEEYIKSNDYVVTDNGDIVDKQGKLIMSFNEAKDKWGNNYKTAMGTLGKSFDKALEAAQGAIEGAGANLDEIKDQANEKLNDVKDKAADLDKKTKETVNEAKEKAKEEIEKGKEKAKNTMDEALKKIQ